MPLHRTGPRRKRQRPSAESFEKESFSGELDGVETPPYLALTNEAEPLRFASSGTSFIGTPMPRLQTGEDDVSAL
jgi:hypothetical protein